MTPALISLALCVGIILGQHLERAARKHRRWLRSQPPPPRAWTLAKRGGVTIRAEASRDGINFEAVNLAAYRDTHHADAAGYLTSCMPKPDQPDLSGFSFSAKAIVQWKRHMESVGIKFEADRCYPSPVADGLKAMIRDLPEPVVKAETVLTSIPFALHDEEPTAADIAQVRERMEAAYHVTQTVMGPAPAEPADRGAPPEVMHYPREEPDDE